MRLARASGVLLHPTSLPGPYGSGDFGVAARHFIDWLATAGQGLWQVLPLGPVGPGASPYMSPSAFAMNPLLIDLDDLVARGWLARTAVDNGLAAAGGFDASRIDYPRVSAFRMTLLRAAAVNCFAAGTGDGAVDFAAFCRAERAWLDDYALFMTIDAAEAAARWQDWPAPLARRDPLALAAQRERGSGEIRFWQFVQWVAARQWQTIKQYANARHVKIVGDVPIFVAPHSVDVWARPDLFDLDATLAPRVVAGVPPDYFSATGQLWGNPLYRWARHRADGFEWWINRVRSLTRQADIVRIDHFRGFVACWEVAAGAPDAIGGRWCAAPGAALFTALRNALGELPIIAEDLGVITDDVTALRTEFALPGMRVLQFAFGGDSGNPYLPHRFDAATVVYTGTHDNDTSRGWFDTASAHERRFVQTYLATDGREIHWDLIQAASASVADYAIYPFQDVLGLGAESRMNRPGRADGCWDWRFRWSDVRDWHAARLRELSAVHGRNALALAF